jgi:hypothetical protein
MTCISRRCGVPLQLRDAAEGSASSTGTMTGATKGSFALAPELITTFNDWLASVPSIHSVEDALRFGMAKCSPGAPCARIGTGDYLTRQRFFQRAAESGKARQQVREDAQRLNANDAKIKHLQSQRLDVSMAQNGIAMAAMHDPMSSLVPRADIQQAWSGYHQQA